MHIKTLFKFQKERFRKITSDWIIGPVCHFLYKRKYKYAAPPEKIIEINIKDIKAWYRGNRYSEFTFPGQIKGGDWSRKITSREVILNKNEKYDGIIQRFKHNIPWKKTDLFRIRYENLLNKGVSVKGYNNLNDIESYYRRNYDNLFQSIKKNGVLITSDKHPDIEPIYVNINKDGELLYTVDGNHRLYMCFILGIEKIPVRVWLRHAEWQDKREYILGNNQKELDGKYKKYLNHPDIVSELEMAN